MCAAWLTVCSVPVLGLPVWLYWGMHAAHAMPTSAPPSAQQFACLISVCACSAEALSARQREAVDQICSELLGSAEIVR